jgi:hypothetical protein
MPRQTLRNRILDKIRAAKVDLVWSQYYDQIGDIISDAIADMLDDFEDSSDIDVDSESDVDLDIPSSDPFTMSTDNFSDPVSDDSMASTDSDYSQILDYCLQGLTALEDEVRHTRVLQPSIRISRAPQIHLLDEWRDHNPRRFRAKVRVDPYIFDELVTLIEAHHIFKSNRQLPISKQLAIFLNRAGHYGNGLTIEDIGEWAGVSAGTVHNCCNRVMIALLQLHDLAMAWDTNGREHAEQKEKAKQWVQSVSCPELRNGYMTGDGTCIPLFQKPSQHGESYFDKKKNYSINCQVCIVFSM